ncbi:MAG: hypothetical protein PHR53_08050, partial [Bacteroidales bacterium]|nr:hypothetical protein [Bacteroidales bacterium]
TVRLVPDETYAQDNQWNKIFSSYTDTLGGKAIGKRKTLQVLLDGSAVVSHTNKNFYTLFDSNGKYVKEFSVKQGGKVLKNLTPIKGIINQNTFFTIPDNKGNIQCFDFNGTLVKTLNLNYRVSDMVALNNNKIAVVGTSSQTTKHRFFIALVDFNTNEEKVIWEHFVDRKDLDINFDPNIEFIDNHIIAAFPTLGGIMIFDQNGKLMTNEKISWVKYLSVEEQQSLIRKEIEDLKNNPQQRIDPSIDPQLYKEKVNEWIQKLESKMRQISKPMIEPAFSTILKTSADQLLFFEIPEKVGENRFHVWMYHRDGKFVGKYMFVCDDYDLSITPSKMVFFNGYIYALQNLKNAEGVPLRLVRFRVIGL